jgi:hypothetical protein
LDPLLLRLVLSFIIGGVWVSMITLTTVKYGARLGGLLAAFPSTAAFSIAFIGWTQSTQSAVDATTALPLALGFTAAYPLVYSRLAAKISFWFSLAGSLAFWVFASLVISVVVVRVDLPFWASVLGFYIVAGTAYVLLAGHHEQSTPSFSVRPTAAQWASRFVMAGGIIVGAVLLSESVGPEVGGVFASFPAIITSTIYIVNRVEGMEASRAVAKPVVIATSFTVVPYLIAARLSYPLVGVPYGTLIAYGVAIPLAICAFFFLLRKK